MTIHGKQIDEIIVPSRPTPPIGITRQVAKVPKPNIATGTNSISNVPAMTCLNGTNCSCSNATSLALGQNTTVENGATVTFTAPRVNVEPGFHAETGANVTIRQP